MTLPWVPFLLYVAWLVISSFKDELEKASFEWHLYGVLFWIVWLAWKGHEAAMLLSRIVAHTRKAGRLATVRSMLALWMS
jgi:hypothetical protein